MPEDVVDLIDELSPAIFQMIASISDSINMKLLVAHMNTS